MESPPFMLVVVIMMLTVSPPAEAGSRGSERGRWRGPLAGATGLGARVKASHL